MLHDGPELQSLREEKKSPVSSNSNLFSITFQRLFGKENSHLKCLSLCDCVPSENSPLNFWTERVLNFNLISAQQCACVCVHMCACESHGNRDNKVGGNGDRISIRGVQSLSSRASRALRRMTLLFLRGVSRWSDPLPLTSCCPHTKKYITGGLYNGL